MMAALVHGDMLKSVYDTNGNGIVANAVSQVGGTTIIVSATQPTYITAKYTVQGAVVPSSISTQF